MEWDLKYLDQEYNPDIVVSEIKQDFRENGELEKPSEEDVEEL